MKKLNFIFFVFVLAFTITSCGSDDENSNCTGALNNGGSVEIDGEVLSLSVAQLLLSSGFDGDVYSFQVGGFSDDCQEIKTLSFTVELPVNSDFDGNYVIKDFFDAGLNDVTAVAVSSANLSSGSQSLIEVSSGSMTVNKLATREYEVDMTGNLTGGGTVDVSFRSEF